MNKNWQTTYMCLAFINGMAAGANLMSWPNLTSIAMAFANLAITILMIRILRIKAGSGQCLT
jgi:hypothetical protein